MIPEGTPLIRVDASAPRYAASKAQRGKGELVVQVQPMVLAASTTRDVKQASRVIPGQLTIDGEVALG